MSRMRAQAESTSAVTVLYLAFELAAARWVVAYGTSPDHLHRGEIAGADGAAKAAQLRVRLPQWRAQLGLPATGPMRRCFEAGRDGVWVHRLLAELRSGAETG